MVSREKGIKSEVWFAKKGIKSEVQIGEKGIKSEVWFVRSLSECANSLGRM